MDFVHPELDAFEENSNDILEVKMAKYAGNNELGTFITG